MKKWIVLIVLFIVVLMPSLDQIFRNKREVSSQIHIASHVPLSGAQAAQGETVARGVKLAIQHNKERFRRIGFELVDYPKDDQKLTSKAIQNAHAMCNKSSLAGIVGHLHTNILLSAMGTYEKCHMPVSSVNTGDDVTSFGFRSANRIVASDAQQAKALARESVLHTDAMMVLHDRSSYGEGFAESYRREYEKISGKKVLLATSITPEEKDMSSTVNPVREKERTEGAGKRVGIMCAFSYPDFINFYTQIRGKGFVGPLFSGDGIASGELVKGVRGTPLRDVYYTSIAGDIRATEKGRRWIQDFQKQFNNAKPEEITYNAYAAGSYLIEVIYQILQGQINEEGYHKKSGERAAVLFTKEGRIDRVLVQKAMRNFGFYPNFIMDVSLDEHGNNTKAMVYLYKFTKNSYPGTLLKSFDLAGHMQDMTRMNQTTSPPSLPSISPTSPAFASSGTKMKAQAFPSVPLLSLRPPSRPRTLMGPRSRAIISPPPSARR